MKKVEGTSCSQSQGCPISRVTTSKKTDVVNPARLIPQRIISPCSTMSSAGHLRCRSARSTSEKRCEITAAARSSFHVPHELQHVRRVLAKLGGDLVLERLRRLLEARLVDILHELDADLLELRLAVMFKLESE